jgi:hypothetical protein
MIAWLVFWAQWIGGVAYLITMQYVAMHGAKLLRGEEE